MRKILFLAVYLCMPLAVCAQADTLGYERDITLDEAIALARVQSVDAAVALNELKTAYWEYRTFRANQLPEVTFTGTIPDYGKSYNSYQNSDGSYTFVHNSTLGMSGQLSVTQNIWLTGGTLSLNSSLDYLRQLGSGGTRQFMSVPVSLQLTQPIFGVNTIKWDRRIEPVRYAEAKAAFITATEEVTMSTITYFFNLLLAKESLATARQNKENADRLYEVAKAKRKMGQISENDLLQLKLNKLNASSSLIQSEQACEQQMFALRNYLGFAGDVELAVVVPEACPEVEVTYGRVLEMASRNNPFRYEVVCSLLEAERQVKEAKAGRGFRADVRASVGFTGSDRTLRNTYRDLRERESVSLGISIPIFDWGKGRGDVEIARSQERVARMRVEQDKLDFEQSVLTAVRQFQEQTRLNEIARLADTISQQRYKTAYETFVLGQISVLDLNAAQTERDDAKRSTISQLYASWRNYYSLRKLTLYDFVEEKNIGYEEF